MCIRDRAKAPARCPPRPHPVSRTWSLHSMHHPPLPHSCSRQCMQRSTKESAKTSDTKPSAPCIPQPTPSPAARPSSRCAALR
eukprot:1968454-Alexandrium_andersonii.AAC.1